MRCVLGAALVLAIACGVQPAAAQSASDGERAVALGNEGVELFKKGRWKEARERFEAADALVHSPVLVVYAARAMRNAGDLLGARSAYRRVAAESISADAAQQWRQAKEDAARELAELEARIPKIVVQVRGTPPTSIRVDGAQVARDRWGAPIDVNPGRHVVVATGATGAPRESSAVVAEGDPPHVVVIEAAGAPAQPVTTSPSAQPPPANGAAPAPDGARGSVWPGVVVLGVGTVALGTGIVTGVVAKSKENKILKRCPTETKCLQSDADEADTAKTLATVSTIGFIGAAIAVPAGVALLVWRPFGTSSSGVVVGPTRVALAGSF
jgi:hypothetical protein